MKNMVMLALMLMLHQVSAYGCDVCGSAGMANTNALWGRQSGHRFGLGYQHSHFRSNHLPELLTAGEGSKQSTRELFSVLMLNGSHAVSDGRFSMHWNIPLVGVKKESLNPTFGLGDARLGLSWNILEDSLWNSSWLWQSTYQLKVPTGRYDASEVNEEVSRYMFPGTGSFDQVFSLIVFGSSGEHRWTAQAKYQWNGHTAQGLNWGDTRSGSLAYFRDFKVGVSRLGAGLWTVLEQRQKDRLDQVQYRFSGYSMFLLAPEVQFQRGSWMMSAKYQYPISSNIAEGQVEILQMWNLQLTYKL